MINNDTLHTYGVEIHLWNKNVAQEHAHNNFYEFAICTYGKIKQIKNKTEESIINSGDVIFITPTDVHSLTSIGNGSPKATHINISFTPNVFKDICSVLGVAESDYDRLKRVVTLTKGELAYVKDLVDSSFSTFTNDDNFNHIRCLKSVVFLITSIIIGHGLEESHKIPEWLLDFTSKINSPKYFDMKISDLYKLSGYSQTSLSNYFRKYYNKSFVQYFNEVKLNYACALLKNTDYLIIQVANYSGFSSLSNFNLLFKNTFGLNPTEYKKNYSNIQYKDTKQKG